MKNKINHKYIFVLLLLLALSAASIGLTMGYTAYERGGQKEAYTIVTSFYPMYIATSNVVGDCENVELKNLSEPQTGCLHDYQLTTGDMKLLSAADAFVVNGGGIESFLSEVAAQYPHLAIIDASEPVNLIEDNAHAWMSIPDHMLQVQRIADALSYEDPVHAGIYQDNCAAYMRRLEGLRAKQQQVADLAGEQQVLVFHEAFDYVAADYGMIVAGGMDLDEERQISAGEVADMVRLIREQGVGLILAEELYGSQMCDTIRREVDVDVVYLDPCTRGDYAADSYLSAMERNIRLLLAAAHREE